VEVSFVSPEMTALSSGLVNVGFPDFVVSEGKAVPGARNAAAICACWSCCWYSLARVRWRPASSR